MKVYNVMNCMFSAWYENFRKITPKSIIISLPNEFIEYLLADGLVLPENAISVRKGNALNDEGQDKDDADRIEVPNFPDLDKSIQTAIDELGGKAFPKMNWSSPRDATWISTNKTAACSSVSDVYLLLKSSDFVTNDLTMPFKFCDDNMIAKPVDYELVLRKWIEIDPATEFRCFAYNHKVIAISQRDDSCYYPYMDKNKDEIMGKIQTFYSKHICSKFPDPNYVFDIYIKNKDCIRLLDFNPFGEITDSLLFEWTELNEIADTIVTNDQNVIFRCVNCDSGVQPNPFRHYAFPRDVIDLSCGSDPHKLIDLLSMKVQIQNEDSSDDEAT